MGIRVSHTPDIVTLKLGPVDSIFALKGRLDVPKSQITSVEVMDRSAVPPTEGAWLRAPGTHVPGLIRYGSYGREPLREFWMARRQKRVVVIGVSDWAYHRLILGVADPESLAADVRTAA